MVSRDVIGRSGMNLLDIHTRQWHQPALDACAPHLADKLGAPVAAASVLV